MAREVLLPQVFHRHRFEKVASYTQIADQLGMVLGPLVAAGLLKLWSWEYVVISTTDLFMAADGAMIIWHSSGRHWSNRRRRQAVGHCR